MLGAIGIEIRRDLCLRHNQVLKRAIDILFAIAIALLVWPIIVVLALAIKLAEPLSPIAPLRAFVRELMLEKLKLSLAASGVMRPPPGSRHRSASKTRHNPYGVVRQLLPL
jgi:hypothetical protein